MGMEGVNRFALIVKPKRRFMEWANALDDGPPLTLDGLASLAEVYLLDATDSEAHREELIDCYADEIWEQQLYQWHTDEAQWPINRTPHTLRDWFDITFVDMVFDADPDVEWHEPVYDDDELIELQARTCQWCRKVSDEDQSVVTLTISLPESDPVRISGLPCVPLEIAGEVRFAVAAREGSEMAQQGKHLLLAFCSEQCAEELRQVILRERAALLS